MTSRECYLGLRSLAVSFPVSRTDAVMQAKMRCFSQHITPKVRDQVLEQVGERVRLRVIQAAHPDHTRRQS